MTSTLYVEARRLHCWLLLYPVVMSRDRQINEERAWRITIWQTTWSFNTGSSFLKHSYSDVIFSLYSRSENTDEKTHVLLLICQWETCFNDLISRIWSAYDVKPRLPTHQHTGPHSRCDKRQKAYRFTAPTCAPRSQCLNKGVVAEQLMGADTMGNFMSPETTQQISW